MLRSGVIRVNKDLHHEIKRLAIEKKITMAKLTEEIIMEYYKSKKNSL